MSGIGCFKKKMLASLSIHNVVLIDQLDLSFEAGLCTLTGETGDGKTMLVAKYFYQAIPQ